MTFLKGAVLALVGLMTVPVAGGVATTVYLATGGMARVQVETPEVSLNLPVPVRLIDVGLGVAELAVPLDERRELHAELMEELGGELDLAALAAELERCPDGRLVDVRTAEETVSVSKENGRLHIRVDAPDAKVRVSVPTRPLVRMAGRISDFVFPDPVFS